MKSHTKTFFVSITSSLIVTAMILPSAIARDTITQKEFLKIKAGYEAARKAVRDAEPADKTAKFKEDLFDSAVRGVNKAKAEKKKIDNDPKSTKDDKDIARINLDDANDVAEANYPGKTGGDPKYRAALKRLRYAEHFYHDALGKERIYPKNFTDLTEPEASQISMGFFGGRNSAKQAADSARNAALAATRGGAHRPCHF